ncbi:MAG: DUF983 domain-containing protein [Coraliomargarita sp.]|nr:DUF983 domain-containing protein [Coraliomargarita sp.]
MNDLEPLPKASHRDIIARGLTGRCPNCGKAKLFRSLVRIHHSCPNCGMRLERGDGFFLGPLCINYGIVALFFVAPLLLIGVAGWIPLKLALALSLGGALLLPIVLYRYSWSWWLMIYYTCLPDELHANRSSDCDDLSFEEEKRAR